MMLTDFPVTLQTRKGVGLAGAIYTGVLMLMLLPGIVAGIQLWPDSPALLVLAISLSGVLLTGWLTYLGVAQWRRPYTLLIDKTGLSITMRGTTRIIPWEDVSQLVQLGSGQFGNRFAALILKPGSPAWVQNKTFPRDQIVLPRFRNGQSPLNSNDFKALLERARADS